MKPTTDEPTVSIRALQLIEPCRTVGDALGVLGECLRQYGCIGGRLIGGGRVVQAFFAPGEAPSGWLPDGLSEVIIPLGQAAALGITERVA